MKKIKWFIVSQTGNPLRIFPIHRGKSTSPRCTEHENCGEILYRAKGSEMFKPFFSCHPTFVPILQRRWAVVSCTYKISAKKSNYSFTVEARWNTFRNTCFLPAWRSPPLCLFRGKCFWQCFYHPFKVKIFLLLLNTLG